MPNNHGGGKPVPARHDPLASPTRPGGTEAFKTEENHVLTLNGVTLQVPHQTRYFDILPQAPHKGPLPPLGVIVGNRLSGLFRGITSDAEGHSVDYTSKQGAFIYRRTACEILYAATRETHPEASLMIGPSLHGGYFFEVLGAEATPEFVQQISDRMHQIVEEDHELSFGRVFVDQAVELLHRMGADGKARWVSQIPRGYIWMSRLLDFYDILRGPLAPRTGAIRNFRVEPYRHGLLLRFPRRDGSERPPVREENGNLLFDTMQLVRRDHEILGVHNVADMIDQCVHGQVGELIRSSEALFERHIVRIADMINDRRDRVRIVLIAGPTASGKTTFAKRLATFLRVLGIHPVTISMDNYYVDRVDTPKHPDGRYNFEIVEALDIDLFNDHLRRLAAGEVIESPIYDFMAGARNPHKTNRMRLRPNSVLVVEGLHALNDRLHSLVPPEAKFKIFVSALTQLAIDQHNRIFTSDTRLIRRIVRDRMFRGYNAAKTIHTWPSVQQGESQCIFPFQDSADVMFNSAHVYEQAVLNPYLKRFLLEVRPSDPAYCEASRLYEFIDLFIPVFPEEVPRDSVLREFIGGSTLDYD
ncbi:nucleoside kinase [bacterium]|nr:nucleoside kinase [bacterium]MCB9476425.1 nucleoside kinase [Deltaproteobacteria bacterium]MCB9478400.1 nucleoside kinase [Deltaproteobacteria bacterium]